MCGVCGEIDQSYQCLGVSRCRSLLEFGRETYICLEQCGCRLEFLHDDMSHSYIVCWLDWESEGGGLKVVCEAVRGVRAIARVLIVLVDGDVE